MIPGPRTIVLPPGVHAVIPVSQRNAVRFIVRREAALDGRLPFIPMETTVWTSLDAATPLPATIHLPPSGPTSVPPIPPLTSIPIATVPPLLPYNPHLPPPPPLISSTILPPPPHLWPPSMSLLILLCIVRHHLLSPITPLAFPVP